MDAEDLSEFQKDLVRYIAVNGPSRVCDIAMYLDTSSAAISRAVNDMNLDYTHKDKIGAKKASHVKIHATKEGRRLGKKLEDEADDTFSMMGMMNELNDS